MPINPKLAVLQGIFQRVDVVVGSRALTELIHEYIDQSSTPSAIDLKRAPAVNPNERAYESPSEHGRQPHAAGAVFHGSIQPTTVHVGGFIESFARGFDLHKPDQLPSGLEAVRKEWLARTNSVEKGQSKPARAHHLLFSVSRQLRERSQQMGFPIHGVLMARAITAINRWASWIHPISSIGYLLGVHSGKPISELHALVFPQDSDGNFLNLSRMARVDAGGRKFRVDYQGFLHRVYEDELAEFAKMLAPENRKTRAQLAQDFARSTLISLRDFPVASDEWVAKKHPDPISAVLAVSHANARNYSTPDALQAEQSSQGLRFAKATASLRLDRYALTRTLVEIAGIVRKLADELGEHIEAIRKAREVLAARHTAYAESPYAYTLVHPLAGGPPIPSTITKKWAESLPRHRDLLLSTNPFLWEIGAKEVTATRVNQAKDFARTAREAVANASASAPAFEAVVTRVGYQVGRFVKIEGALRGATPAYLATAITNEPVSPLLASPDKGGAIVRHNALEAGYHLLMRNRPFDIKKDADRDFSPAFRHDDRRSDRVREHQLPVLPDKSLLYCQPQGIDPENTYEPPPLPW